MFKPKLFTVGFISDTDGLQLFVKAILQQNNSPVKLLVT